MKRYYFFKPYKIGENTVPAGTDLSVVNGVIYYNEGMVDDYYQGVFGRLIAKEERFGFDILRPRQQVYNKV